MSFVFLQTDYAAGILDAGRVLESHVQHAAVGWAHEYTFIMPQWGNLFVEKKIGIPAPAGQPLNINLFQRFLTWFEIEFKGEYLFEFYD